MRKPRIQIRALCVLQKAEIDIHFDFDYDRRVKFDTLLTKSLEKFPRNLIKMQFLYTETKSKVE